MYIIVENHLWNQIICGPTIENYGNLYLYDLDLYVLDVFDGILLK